MPEPLRIGFWNVQRYAQTNPGRANLVRPALLRWLRGDTRADSAPDILALCEVGAGGDAWANQNPNFWADNGYRAAFVPVRSGSATGISPCSFLLARRLATTADLFYDIVGQTTVRPMVQLRPSWADATIVACHLKARRDIALDELETFLIDITSPARTVFYGDLNMDFATAPQTIRTGADWQKVAPGLTWSFVSKRSTDLRRRERLIDFAYTAGIGLVPEPPYPRYALWKTIDHAPIQYRLPSVTRAQDPPAQLMTPRSTRPLERRAPLSGVI